MVCHLRACGHGRSLMRPPLISICWCSADDHDDDDAHVFRFCLWKNVVYNNNTRCKLQIWVWSSTPYYTSSSSLPTLPPHTNVLRIIRSLQYTYILLTTSPPPPTTTAAARDIHKSNQDELPIQYPSPPPTYPNMPHPYISSSMELCALESLSYVCLYVSGQRSSVVSSSINQSCACAAITHPPNH